MAQSTIFEPMEQNIERVQKPLLAEQIANAKLVLVKGPRKVGKEALIAEVLNEQNQAFCQVNCQDKKNRKAIEEGDFFASVSEAIIVLEEAQYLSNLQQILEAVLMGKINHNLIISCSFKPAIEEELLEALRIEGMDFTIYAPSFYESAQHFGLTKEEELLEQRLIYGNYPSVLANLDEADFTLKTMIEELIHTQLGAHDRVNKGDKLMRMLQLLAFSVGEPVSYNEIGERCGLDNETVERYIQLFEDAFLLIKLPSMYNENRYELKKTHCIYFQDNGVRNALISNFNDTFLRNDMDQLWRNYLIAERVKWIRMNGMNKELYFWRTHTRQQMDFIEVGDKMMAYKTEPKTTGWEKRKKVKIPKSFETYYPEAKTSVLNRSTYWNFLTRKV